MKFLFSKILNPVIKFSLIFLILFILVFNRQIPTFIYNEIEFRQRADYIFAEELRDKIDYLIGIRTGETDVLASDQEKRDLTETIDEGLEQVINLMNDYQRGLGQQDKIPFLPGKYRNYQELKKTGFNDYRQAQGIFQEVKTIEHSMARIVGQLDQTHQLMADDVTQLDTAASIAQTISDQTESLYSGGKISRSVYDYIDQDTQNIIEASGVAVSDYDPDWKIDRIREIFARGDDLDFTVAVNEWHGEIINPLNEKITELDDSAYTKMTAADQYYRDNNLGRDTISRLLAKINKGFPRNY